MATSTKAPAKSGFQQRPDSGTLFYDAPGAPTMSGDINCGGTSYKVTAEPAVDKNQKSYLKIVGDGVSGGLWQNEHITNEKSPEFRGPATFGGTKKRLAAWKKPIKSGDNEGQDFFSIAVSDPLPPRE